MPSCLQVGGLKAILAPSWRVLGPSWLQVGWSEGYLGSKLGGLKAILSPSCRVLGPSWLKVGRSKGHLGPKLGGQLAIFGSKLGGLRGNVGLLSCMGSSFYCNLCCLSYHLEKVPKVAYVLHFWPLRGGSRALSWSQEGSF